VNRLKTIPVSSKILSTGKMDKTILDGLRSQREVFGTYGKPSMEYIAACVKQDVDATKDLEMRELKYRVQKKLEDFIHNLWP